jgi:DNA sulfur modification protein DndC
MGQIAEIQKPSISGWSDVINDVKEEYLSTKQSYPWVIGFSGGKDSTLVTHAVFQMLTEIRQSQRDLIFQNTSKHPGGFLMNI